MTPTLTQNDLLEYLYTEQSHEEKKRLDDYLAQDSSLSEEYHDFLSLKDDLGTLERSPDKAVIDNILNYSQNFVQA